MSVGNNILIALGDETMTAIVSTDHESLGCKTKRLRISQHMTRQELANIAGVSTEEVALLEGNLPVRLEVKRKLLRQLWATKACKSGVSGSSEYVE